ncbi:XdhC family protein [Priestia megaterium]|uniref:XdhC family protein n=1 Tax=Priestia megaterium TaxID=1404 RepID=UPI000BF3F5B0|nr:XdhC/CoxI family protein [Priestia megaterium]PEX12803.1 xanthine dehydrogenase [Priestia megaterium]
MHDILHAVNTSTVKSVLATIVHVEGSSYLKEGTSMLFQENGENIGMLSAGCVEADIAERVKELFDTEHVLTVTYNLKEEGDAGWGQGAGCNGILYILLEPVTARMKKNLLRVKRHLDNRNPVLHIKKLEKNFTQTTSFYVEKTGETFGANSDASSFATDDWNGRKSGIQLSNCSLLTYAHLYKPKPRLVIWGAGADAKYLVALAVSTGFFVTLCDWRPALCNKEHFPLAEEIHIGFPEEVDEHLSVQRDDFVVIMTHNFYRDQEILSLLKSKTVKYIGVLGPKKRTLRLLNTDIPSHIHSPVGLSIGAVGPQEIAVSIVAELIGTLRMCDGKKG